MKSVILSTLMVASITLCFSQLPSGTMSLGGALEIGANGTKWEQSSGDMRDPRSFDFKIAPSFGYFFNDNISIGGAFGVDLQKTTDFTNDVNSNEIKLKNKSNSIWAGPELNCYHPLIDSKKFGIIGQSSLGYGCSGGENESYDFFNDEIIVTKANRHNYLFLSAVPGLYYAPKECIVLTFIFSGLSLNYQYDVEKVRDSDDKHKTHNFNLGGDLDNISKLSRVQVGARVILQ